MKSRLVLATFLCAGAGALAPAPHAAAGPVNYTAQQRRIEAGLTEDYGSPAGPQELRTDTESATAPDFADFEASVAARIDNPPRPTLGEGNATMRSTLGDAGITVDGSANGFTGTDQGFYSFRVDTDVTFVLDESRTFRLDYVLGIGNGAEAQTSDLMLSGGDGGAVFDEAFDFTQPGPDNDLAAVGSRTGTLAAGTYRFQLVHGLSTDVGDEGIPFSVSLALSPTDENPGPGPNPIPLPPAAWAAVVAAGGLGALRRASRLVRRRA